VVSRVSSVANRRFVLECLYFNVLFSCILGELLLRRPLFPGKEEVQQLELIWKLCGSPNDENWPDVGELPLYSMLYPQRVYKRRIREAFKQ